MALISVVVPVYRVEDYLAECLDSILGQGFADLEVVAVDDASDDGSASILAGYAARDPRVRVLTLPANRGLGAARNAGLAAATGEYVWFVDSDDWLTEGTLRAVADRLLDTKADLLVTGFARVFPNGRIRENKVSWAGPAPDTFRLAEVPGLMKLLHIACNRVVSRQLLVDLGLAFRPGWYEDVAFSVPLMIAAERITLLDRYSYGYRQRETGAITRTVSDRHFEVFDQWEFVFRFLADRGAEELRAPIFARAVWHLLQVLNHGARVPPSRRREFFARLVAFYRAQRPAGGYPLPPGDEGAKHRLVAYNAFLLFEALRAGRRMQARLARRASRPRGAQRPVPDPYPSPVPSSSSWSLLNCPAPAGRRARFKRWFGVRVFRLPRQRVLIVAANPGQVRELLARPESATPARSVRIMVWWQAIRPGWSGAIDPLPRLRRHQVSLPLRKRGVASVTFALHEPLPLRDIVRSGLNALLPVRRMPMPASPDIAATGMLPAFLPPSARFGTLPPPDEIRPTDVLLAAEPAAEPDAAGAVLASDRSQAGGAVLLDAIRINPRGRPDRTAKGELKLVLGEPRSGPKVRSGPLDGIGLDQLTIEIVRRRATIDATDLAGWSGDPAQAAAMLVQIAATGAVLRAPELPPAVSKLLSPELAAVLAETAPAGDDPVALEVHSIRQRRAALRGHAAELVLPRLAADAFPQLRVLPTVSAILMTRRPEILVPVLDALEKQSYPELEIVIGLHGCPPTDAVTAWAARCARPVQVVDVPAGVDFGTGLGMVTARSNGSLVTKVDDDDTYGPEHIWDLVLARHYSGATMVGKGAEFVHLEERNETIRRKFGNPESFAESVAGGTIMIGRGDLENAGGWRPVPRSVDLGIITRVKADGGLIYRTHPFGYIYHRRAKGHTWDPGQQYFLDQAVATWPGLPPYAEFGVPLASTTA